MIIENNTDQTTNISLSNELFQGYTMTIASDIVWKNQTLANSYEDSDDFYLVELFITASRELLNFSIVKSFPRAILRNIGIATDMIDRCSADKNLIPDSLKDNAVIEYQRALREKNPITGIYEYYDKSTSSYILVYEEKNNYYRTLFGLPNYGDTNYIYNTDIRWSTTTPIHLMSIVDRLEMERDGVLDKLATQYPKAEYIKYLGYKKIDIARARTASRFDILYYTSSSSGELDRIFLEEYLKSAYLINTVYYSNAFKRSNTLYENFLAMCILFATIQSVCYKYLQADTGRNFFDIESLKLIYDSYQVPFYSEIPLDYHIKIVKNMNKLISYKGSSNVFFDLFKIFDLATMNIYSYYLTKTHKLDDLGNPLFIIAKDSEGNDMYDENGDPILDSSVYELNFSKVEIGEDPALAVSDPANQVSYDSITGPDPYWIEDEDLQEKLKSEYFNFTESKYLGIQTIFDLMKITFESAYIFRMITDNRKTSSNLKISWNEVGLTVDIFSIFIYLAALYCRYYKYQGIITDHIPAIMDTLGYNFEEAISILNNDIANDSILSSDTTLSNLMNTINISIVNNVDLTYTSLEELREYIVDKYRESKSKKEFFAYKELYNSLMISKEVTSTYTNSTTGELYTSFTDLLTDIAPELMQRYLLLTDDDVQIEMDIVINQIEKSIPSLRYMSYLSGSGTSNMVEALFKILKFFKSAKADLVEYNITYIINNKGINFFKLMDDIEMIYHYSGDDDETYFLEAMKTISEFMKLMRDRSTMSESFETVYHYYYLENDILLLKDLLKLISDRFDKFDSSSTWYADIVKSLKEEYKIYSRLLLNDTKELILVNQEVEANFFDQLIKDKSGIYGDILYDGNNVARLYVNLILIDNLARANNIILGKNLSINSTLNIIDKLISTSKAIYKDQYSELVMREVRKTINRDIIKEVSDIEFMLEYTRISDLKYKEMSPYSTKLLEGERLDSIYEYNIASERYSDGKSTTMFSGTNSTMSDNINNTINNININSGLSLGDYLISIQDGKKTFIT